jgi:hypothetical protein
MTEYGVVMFHTTSSVMKAEKVLLNKGLSARLIPTPRQFSSDCGLALRFEWDQRESVEAELNTARVEIAGLHQMPSS